MDRMKHFWDIHMCNFQCIFAWEFWNILNINVTKYALNSKWSGWHLGIKLNFRTFQTGHINATWDWSEQGNKKCQANEQHFVTNQQMRCDTSHCKYNMWNILNFLVYDLISRPIYTSNQMQSEIVMVRFELIFHNA